MTKFYKNIQYSYLGNATTLSVRVLFFKTGYHEKDSKDYWYTGIYPKQGFDLRRSKTIACGNRGYRVSRGGNWRVGRKPLQSDRKRELWEFR